MEHTNDHKWIEKTNSPGPTQELHAYALDAQRPAGEPAVLGQDLFSNAEPSRAMLESIGPLNPLASVMNFENPYDHLRTWSNFMQ